MVSAVAHTNNAGTTNAHRLVNRPDLARETFRVLGAMGRKTDAGDPEATRAAASQLLAELFFTPMLAEMRDFPFGKEFADGGQTESIFGQHLDQRIADTVAASDRGLISQVARYLRKDAPTAQESPAEPTGDNETATSKTAEPAVAGAGQATWHTQLQARSHKTGGDA